MSLVRKLLQKPWTDGGVVAVDESPLAAVPTEKIGLWAFLFTSSGVFGLFMVAYQMRIELTTDWVPIPKPALLWLNTLVLILASVAFEYTKRQARQMKAAGIRHGLILSGLLSFAFLAGQLGAWNELEASGYFLADNPANSFFYLLTGLHGVHLIGGLLVWAKATWRSYAGFEVTLSVELCATYWHFLLLVWVVLYGLLLST
ncbi:MAG: cytochrome c oxidase subunit 3 [Gammaproteobacteria bacterium]